ncbi:MAG: peptidyl-prolyl cis-trans isomerase [Candidatus Omnitrophota bacterium]
MGKCKMILVLSVCILFVTCYNSYCYGQDVAVNEDKIVAEVGGEAIYFSEIKKIADKLNKFLKENFYNSESWRINFIRQYIVQTALAKRAIDEGLDKDEEIIFEIGNFKNSILAEKILENKVKEIVLNEQDFKDHYDKNKEQYTTKDRVNLEYAVFDTKKKANAAVANINKGKDLEDIAKKEGTEKKETWITKDSPAGDPELETLLIPAGELDVFSLETGGVSEPREKDGKFYVMIVKKKEPARVRPYNEVERQVISDLQRISQENVIKAFIGETFDKEGIKIYQENM